MTRYQHLANYWRNALNKGCIAAERLPSVANLSQEHGVSISTIQQAYQILKTFS
jgi:DNA-binding transcriptional regulator YhcF (GntR family)